VSARRPDLIGSPTVTVPAHLRVGGLLQRKCACGKSSGLTGECAECDKKRLTMQRKSTHQTGATTVPSIVHDVLRSTGQPLDGATRALMESRFGHDFSRVRVHADARANHSARAVNALAYTVGQDVVFGAGQYAPHAASGRKLLAHELAHVIQQSSAPGTLASGMDKGASDPLEQAADRLAERVVSNNKATNNATSATSLAALPRLSSPMLQRYAVPSDLACSDVVDWLDNNSPYKPEWAETKCTYAFNGGLKVNSSTSPDGSVQMTAKGHDELTVTVNCPIDRPTWTPAKRDNLDAEVAAWKSMRKDLDAHENEHRKIGKDWRATLEGRFRAVDVTVTGTDQNDARQKLREKLATDQQGWTAEAQAAQSAIDPFRGAILTCP